MRRRYADSDRSQRMITIEQVDLAESRPVLGRECRFVAKGGDAAATVEYFLEHEGVLYPSALPAEPDGSVRVYPEAPGRYVLTAAWRSPGDSGWTQTEFLIEGVHEPIPQRVNVAGRDLRVPTAWDGRLLRRIVRRPRSHEQPLVHALRDLVRPGATVYDIGASIGLFAVSFARWIGERGWLYAIEPNPVCVSFLRANLAAARVRRYTILPTAVSDRREEIDFTLNYASCSVGTIAGSSDAVAKPGHHIGIAADSLDGLVARFNLRPPDLIKLDVEGAEAQAVAGMTRTLEAHRPVVAIELHGLQPAAATLRLLGRLGYTFSVPPDQTTTSAEALVSSLRDECVQVIGFP
jgi:FkbM family methyltransferase